MPQATNESDAIQVAVRYFAAARAAAGTESENVTLPAGTTVAELVDSLASRGVSLATVLNRCSFLCDGVAVRDRTTALPTGATVDILPPFSGG